MSTTATYEPLLPGIGLAGFRSFASWQELRLTTKVTVLAGTNNSGKSNILRFLQSVVPKLQASDAPGAVTLTGVDLPTGFGEVPPLQVGAPVRLTDPARLFDPRRSPRAPSNLAEFQQAAMALLSVDNEIYWSRFTMADGMFDPPKSLVDEAVAAWPDWERTFHRALDALGGGAVNQRDVMRRLLRSIGGFATIPTVATITSSRRVEPSLDGNPDWSSGRGIIRALGEAQNPPHENWGPLRLRWSAINAFVRNVLDDQRASLNIPHDFSTIQVETPQRVLPLASLGSGIEQVVVLASAATVLSKTLVCIEEPETNLHPLLQKKLIRYLTDHTDNQYVIATHSPHLLDDSRSTAYHIRLTTGGTIAQVARRPFEHLQICHDLGYRPSDLLQANCVIWVEGPSDRIYIRRWIEIIDPELVEGIDYSVMFYGGRLLSHLSVSEEALDDFINLRRLSRSSAVVMDSDKRAARGRLGATKIRIRKEFEADQPAPGFAWVTNCNTIENYLPQELLQSSVATVHPGRQLQPFDRWTNPLTSPPGGQSFDKIAIAAAAAESLGPESLDVFDLRRRVICLREFIRSANEHSTAPEGAGAQ